MQVQRTLRNTQLELEAQTYRHPHTHNQLKPNTSFTEPAVSSSSVGISSSRNSRSTGSSSARQKPKSKPTPRSTRGSVSRQPASARTKSVDRARSEVGKMVISERLSHRQGDSKATKAFSKPNDRELMSSDPSVQFAWRSGDIYIF